MKHSYWNYIPDSDRRKKKENGENLDMEEGTTRSPEEAMEWDGEDQKTIFHGLGYQ